MKVAELAKQLNTTSDTILTKLKSFKLKARDSEQELNDAVVSVLRSALGKDTKAVHREPEPVSVPKADEKEIAKATKDTKAKVKTEPPREKEKVVKEKKASPVKPEIKSKDKENEKEKEKEKPKIKIEEPFVSVKPLQKRKKKLSTSPTAKELPTKDALDHSKPASVSEADKVNLKVKVEVSGKFFQELTAGEIEQKKSSETMAGAQSESTSHLKSLELDLPISVKDFAVRLQEKPSLILKKLMQMGIFANINQSLNDEVVRAIAASFGFNITKVKTQEEQLIETHKSEDEDASLLKPRAPVVTFMGHVDHGKTSLLDKIRKSKVADQEHGGITQHIGAYSVNHPRGKITFLDTPGHEAFTAMRARGAHITDIVVLVVAADEGIMPQTEEAIDHARAAQVPIVVAMNKIDKSSADPERVKKELADIGLLPEDWGGKTIVVGVSAMTGDGIDNLLEMILLEAELLELKANYDKRATGIVIEGHMSHGKGALASVIVQNGTLNEGDIVVVGAIYGKVRAMFDDRERSIKQAGPSIAAEILGLPAVPEAGDIFYVVETEKTAKEIAGKRQDQIKQQKLQSTSKITLEDLYSQIKEGKIKELNVIVKADVQGSLEALIDSLAKIPSEEVQLKFIHKGIGEINSSDVILADASNAIIIGFQVDINTRAKQDLEKHPVDVKTYRIIYDAVNDMRKALEGLLEPKTRKKFMARIEVRQVFKLSKSGIVAGCFVQKGKVSRKANVDVLRNGEIVFSNIISSLKRFKDDVRDVGEGMECGITVQGFDAIQTGDVLEAYELEKIARKL